jgi:hypothetical protein
MKLDKNTPRDKFRYIGVLVQARVPVVNQYTEVSISGHLASHDHGFKAYGAVYG